MTAAIDALLDRHPEKPKLLGCPWCGGEPEIANPLKNSAMRRWYCHNCQVYGPWGTDDADAAASWNRRATPADDDNYRRGLRDAAQRLIHAADRIRESLKFSQESGIADAYAEHCLRTEAAALEAIATPASGPVRGGKGE